jgi:hypothetical protein
VQSNVVGPCVVGGHGVQSDVVGPHLAGGVGRHVARRAMGTEYNRSTDQHITRVLVYT